MTSLEQVLQGEIAQYKLQVDQLDQMTQRLVTGYPNDDSSRLSRTNENIGLRYLAIHSG